MTLSNKTFGLFADRFRLLLVVVGIVLQHMASRGRAVDSRGRSPFHFNLSSSARLRTVLADFLADKPVPPQVILE
jgi:hypothetical protein